MLPYSLEIFNFGFPFLHKLGFSHLTCGIKCLQLSTMLTRFNCSYSHTSVFVRSIAAHGIGSLNSDDIGDDV